MTDIDRRHLIGALALGSATLAGSLAANAAPKELKMSDMKKDTESPASITAISATTSATTRCCATSTIISPRTTSIRSASRS